MEKVAAEYFTSINFTYRSLVSEISNFESLLGGQWSSLPSQEQDALLDEHFLPSHIRKLYPDTANLPDDVNIHYPILKIKSGQRMVEDDEGEIWQDEHSGPFSWRTSSQNDLSLAADFTNFDDLKIRSKDPKRPKSPRLIKASSGGDMSKSLPLERTSSSDFHNLRHHWEAQAGTPDNETLPIFPSKSQESLTNQNLYNSRPTSASTENLSFNKEIKQTEVNALVVNTNLKKVMKKEDNVDGVKNNLQMVNSDSNKKQAETTEQKESNPSTSSAISNKQISMQEDIMTMTEINAKMEDSINKTWSTKSADSKTSGQAEESKPAQEDDILKKFGVKFSYGDEEPAPPASSEILVTATRNSIKKSAGTQDVKDPSNASLPAEFDFLTSW